jgi:hypothetical protein
MAVGDTSRDGDKRASLHPEGGRRSDLSLCATLLSLFDFSAQGHVTRADWERGLSTLLLGGLSEDEDLWSRLLGMYDPHGKGAVQLAAVRDVLPIDPRISVLLQQLVHSVAGCREYVTVATKKAQRDSDLRSQRAVINMRKRLLAPIFGGWLEVVKSNKKLKARAMNHLKHHGVGRAFRGWIEMIEANAAAERCAPHAHTPHAHAHTYEWKTSTDLAISYMRNTRKHAHRKRAAHARVARAYDARRCAAHACSDAMPWCLRTQQAAAHGAHHAALAAPRCRGRAQLVD